MANSSRLKGWRDSRLSMGDAGVHELAKMDIVAASMMERQIIKPKKGRHQPTLCAPSGVLSISQDIVVTHRKVLDLYIYDWCNSP